MSTNLADLVDKSLRLERALFESNGELTPELEAELSAFGGEVATKVDNIAFALKSLQLREEQFRERARECQALAKAFEKAQDRLRGYVVHNIERLKTDSVEGNEFKFSIRENPGRLEIIDESLIPDGFKTVVTTIVPDKERIKKALIQGINISGVNLVKEKTVQVRMRGVNRK